MWQHETKVTRCSQTWYIVITIWYVSLLFNYYNFRMSFSCGLTRFHNSLLPWKLFISQCQFFHEVFVNQDKERHLVILFLVRDIWRLLHIITKKAHFLIYNNKTSPNSTSSCHIHLKWNTNVPPSGQYESLTATCLNQISATHFNIFKLRDWSKLF